MARDKFHYQFREALEKEGWVITKDPLHIKIGRFPIQIDLGAERQLLIAEKGSEKIAVEVKTLGNDSLITALYEAVGKYIIYRKALKMKYPGRVLFLAVHEDVYEQFRKERLVNAVFKEERIHLVVFDEKLKTITSWIKR